MLTKITTTKKRIAKIWHKPMVAITEKTVYFPLKFDLDGK